jgi:putative OPT family oligopeptide transporter
VAEPLAPQGFKPYVPDEANLPELTMRALLLGSFLGLFFGASSVYLGLKVGLTVSASIPIAVISITVLRFLSKAFGAPASILENNIVQTAGSAGESIAGGVIFTIPALIFLGFEMDWTRTMVLALMGGVLGVLMMIPLRRYLIVKEHGRLTYPEGTACAEVLIVGETGGTQAGVVFRGLFVGAMYKFLNLILALWNEFPDKILGFYNRTARLRLDTDPALMGVGYIIGYRSSALMVGGGILASMVLIPAIALFGEGRATALYPASDLIGQMGPDEIWSNYIRYIGAGAVAAGGIINLVRAMPTIVDSFASSFRDLRLARTGGKTQLRTERDIPINVVLIGSVLLAFTMTLIPQLHVNLMAAVLIIVFGFFFSVVASRITGELGSSSCPISGMAIATLMGTCLIFILLGWTGHPYEAVALAVGGVVCIASSNAGTTSQDLKTGYLVGATPWKQQLALMTGVLACVFVVGWTLLFLNRNFSEVKPASFESALGSDPQAPEQKGPDGVSYQVRHIGGLAGVPDGVYLADGAGRIHFEVVQGIGSKKASAPQARLMALVIRGILTRQLPWGLVLIGVFLSILLEIVGVPALAFAVGVYLPLESTTPVYAGGLVRWLIDRQRGSDAEADSGPGILYSSGLIAGASLMGLVYAFLQPDEFKQARELFDVGRHLPASLVQGPWLGLVSFTLVCVLLYRAARSSAAAPAASHR